MSHTTIIRDQTSMTLTAIVLVSLSLAVVGCGSGEKQEPLRKAGREPLKQESRVAEKQNPTVTRTVPTEGTSLKRERRRGEPQVVGYDEAEAAYFEERYDEAAELFSAYAERKSENPWGFYMLGLSAWKAGKYGIAEDAFEKALVLDPGHVKSLLNWSRVLLDTDQPRQALAKLDQAMTIDPGSSASHRLLGRAYHQLGQLEEAVGAYRQAILIDDEDVWSMNNMGLIFIEEGLFHTAVPPLARAVELRDDVAVFWNNLGMALERSGDFLTALDAYEKAVALDGSADKPRTNSDRVTSVVEGGSTESSKIDLTEQAALFEEEIEGWRGAGDREELAVTDGEGGDGGDMRESRYSEDSETAMVDRADSTGSDAR